MSGWIKIHRQLLDWEWSDNPQMMALWINLLLRANVVATEYQGRIIERGEVLTSLRSLAKETGLSLMQVRTCLERLKGAGQITITHKATHEVSRANTLITVCKFDDYQYSDNDMNTRNNTQSNTISKEKEKNQKKEENIQETKKEICLSKESHIKKETTNAFLSLAGDLEKSICKKTAKAEFDLSAIDVELKPLFLDYIAMRKKIGKPLKTQLGITGRYNRLQRLSGGNTGLAKKIIRQSLEYEWQDFYALRSEEEEKLRKKKKAITTPEYSDKKYWN